MSKPDSTPSVLFVCVKNGGKSQMAAALMRKIAGDSVQRVLGRNPSREPPSTSLSAESLAEVGVDITDQIPKPLDPELVRDVDLVVTLGREAHVEPVARDHASRTGTPTNPPNAASTASNACVWSATTSPHRVADLLNRTRDPVVLDLVLRSGVPRTGDRLAALTR